jgi:hypothetical protein
MATISWSPEALERSIGYLPDEASGPVTLLAIAQVIINYPITLDEGFVVIN